MDGFVEYPGLHCSAWDALRPVLHRGVCGMLCGVGNALGLLLCEGVCGVF